MASLIAVWRDKACWSIVNYLMPKRLVTWAYVQVVAFASTGEYSSTVLPELSVVDALKRWEDD